MLPRPRIRNLRQISIRIMLRITSFGHRSAKLRAQNDRAIPDDIRQQIMIRFWWDKECSTVQERGYHHIDENHHISELVHRVVIAAPGSHSGDTLPSLVLHGFVISVIDSIEVHQRFVTERQFTSQNLRARTAQYRSLQKQLNVIILLCTSCY